MGVRKRETYVNVQCNPSPHPNTVLLSSLVQASWGKETKSVSAGSAAPLWSGLDHINRLRLFLPRIASFLWPPNNMMPISAECSQWTTAPMFRYSFKYSCWNKYWNFRGFFWRVGVGLFGETGFQELLGASSHQQQQSLTFRQIRIYFFQGTAG